jgi:GT2 family glycosyltransferase
MNKNKIAVVVLTWNDWKNTIKALDSILINRNNNFDIVLVDNNSNFFHINKIIEWIKNKIKNTYSSVEFKFIKKNFVNRNNINKTIYIIRNKKNLGLTAGLNVGYNFAINNLYTYISRIDCDVIIEQKFFSKLLNTIKKENTIAVSPKILHGSKKNTIWWSGFEMTSNYLKFRQTMNLKKRRIINSDSYKGTKHTDAIAGACSFYKTIALKKYGTGDEDFFFGPEDIELSWRLKKHGILLVNQDTLAYHKIARSSAVSGTRIRTLNECLGFLMLIKKIGTLSDKLVGYTFSILKSFYLIIRSYNKERQLITLGYLQGLYYFFFFKKKK